MNKAKFIEGNIETHLWQFALPFLLSVIVNMSFAALDTYFLAKVGHSQLTAISFIFAIMMIVSNLGLALGIAASINIANALGQGDHQRATKLGSTALLFGLLLSIGMMLIGYCGNHFIFTKLLGAPESLMPCINQFTLLWYANLPLSMLMYSSNFLLRAHGKAKISSSLLLMLAVINLILDPILIFGCLGIPPLGMYGAAIAAIVAYCITIAATITYIVKKKNLICFKLTIKQITHYTRCLFKTYIPTSITNLMPAISIALTTYLLAGISQHAVAAYGVASKVQSLALTPLFALSGALNPIIAQNYGANLHLRALRAVTISNHFAIIWGIAMTLLLLLIKTPIAEIFTHNPATLHAIAIYFEVVPISITGWGVVMMTCAHYNGLNKPAISSWITFIRMIAIFIPLACLLKWLWGYTGIFIAFSLCNLIVGIGCMFMLKHTYRKELNHEAIAVGR